MLRHRERVKDEPARTRPRSATQNVALPGAFTERDDDVLLRAVQRAAIEAWLLSATTRRPGPRTGPCRKAATCSHHVFTPLPFRCSRGGRFRSSEILVTMPNHVELGRRAQRDLRSLPDGGRTRIVRALREDLAADPLPPNLDLVPLRGRAPWLRLRSGDWRVLLRPLSAAELAGVAGTAERGFLVARIVNRGDLDRAITTLPGID
jgi:mRNA-degrading endonuclease RelE of RelBE toxin-antitoxin system